ncbi:MAG: PadR family transcriptional regulator [Bacteroidales bacterium]|nr:PadR family transcriptional regulator [Bacteroidales bacterium]
MKVENIQSQMRKGVLEYCILSIIKSGEVYPGDIIEEVKNAGLDLLEGTLYPLLNRLKNANILSYRWVESTTGPPRKYFSLTDKGLTFYNLLESTWNDLSGSVEILVHKANEVENENEEDIATVS